MGDLTKRGERLVCLSCGVVTLSLSYLMLLSDVSGISKTKLPQISSRSESSRTAILDTPELLRPLNMMRTTGDSQSGSPLLRLTFQKSNPETFRVLLNAIRFVETGDLPDCSNVIGDEGRSLGPYQISKDYWTDAVTYRPEIGGRYEDVVSPYYAELIICAYWDRWFADGSWEERARCHNGGPLGPTKRATEDYWEKVRASIR